MNFEQLLENKKSKNKDLNLSCKKLKKKKSKKFFEFQIDDITFYDLTLFQNITVKIINVPFQDKTLSLSDLDMQKQWSSVDVFMFLTVFILFYFFISEFMAIWYRENIALAGFNLNDHEGLTSVVSSLFFNDDTFCKKLSKVNIFLNSSVLDFLNAYGYLS